jgi:hypothetical protein
MILTFSRKILAKGSRLRVGFNAKLPLIEAKRGYCGIWPLQNLFADQLSRNHYQRVCFIKQTIISIGHIAARRQQPEAAVFDPLLPLVQRSRSTEGGCYS